MNEPIIKGIKLKPLNTYRWSAIREYVNSEVGSRRDPDTSSVFAFAALAMSDNERVLHLYPDKLNEAVVDIGLELTNEEFMEVAQYMICILNLKSEAEVESLAGKTQ